MVPIKLVPVLTLTGVLVPDVSLKALVATDVSLLDEDNIADVPGAEVMLRVDPLETSKFEFDVPVKLPVDACNTKFP